MAQEAALCVICVLPEQTGVIVNKPLEAQRSGTAEKRSLLSRALPIPQR